MLATRNIQFFQNKLSFGPDLQFYWELTVDISGVLRRCHALAVVGDL